MKPEATFVRSAAAVSDLPADGIPEIALVGRSNVGKSSLINALVRQRLARTSAAPGKTRLANIYRVQVAQGVPFHLVDLPGYGYARGGRSAAQAFDDLTHAYFARERRRPGQGAEAPSIGRRPAALLLVDSRHPGLESDKAAWTWLHTAVDEAAVVATKVDKLARGERIRALRELESVFQRPVLPVSAVTGEGLDELWRVINQLANSSSHPRRSRTHPRATAPLLPKKATR